MEYGTNPCPEVFLSEKYCESLRNYPSMLAGVERQNLMDKHLAGVLYEDALAVLKEHFPEKFI